MPAPNNTEQASVTELSGVGPALAAKLARLHIYTVQDVLFHLPYRFEDRTTLSEIGALVDRQSVVVIGEIQFTQVVFGRRRTLLINITDSTGFLTIRLFHFSRAQEKAFKRRLWLRCFGQVRRGQKGFEMVHPEYQVHPSRPIGGLDETLTPIYSTTEGVSQHLWRKISDQALARALPQVQEH